MGAYGIWMLLSSLFSGFLGGGIVFFTLKSKKKEAAAQAQNAEAIAEGSELSNVEKAIKIWREMAESLRSELETQRTKTDEMAVQVEALRKEISRLTKTNNKIIELLNNMDQENFEKMAQKIKDEIHKDSNA